MKRLTLLFAVVGLALVAGGGFAGYRAWHDGQIRELISINRPKLPILAGVPRELVERITQADQSVPSGRESLTSLIELSRLYYANGFVPEAAQCYQLLLQADPDNARWPHLLATIVAGYGQLDEAWPLWQRATQLAPEYAPAGIRLGDALLKLNDFGRATAAYDKVLRLPGDHPHALVGRARVDLHFGRRAAAQERLEAAVMQTNYQIGADLLTTVYEETQQPARAIEIRSRSKSSGSFSDFADPWVDELFSECYDVYRLQVAGGMAEHRGDDTTALSLLQRALALSPQETSTLYQLGMYHLRKQQPAVARDYFQQCIALRPDFPDGWAQLIVVLRGMGDQSGVEHTLETALLHCPGSPGLHLERARALAAANRLNEAIREFQETIRLRPEEADPYVALASIYFSQDRVEEGIKELRNALKVEPDNPLALSTMAFAAIGTGNETEARKLLERIKLQPRTPAGALQALTTAFYNQFGRSFP